MLRASSGQGRGFFRGWLGLATREEIGAPLPMTSVDALPAEHLQVCIDRLIEEQQNATAQNVRANLTALRALVENRAGGALREAARAYALQIGGLRDPGKAMEDGDFVRLSRTADAYNAAVEEATYDPLERKLLKWLPHDNAVQRMAEEGTSLELRVALLRRYMAS